uniref:ZP domain-containing protein n=1 Tax=Caenorhabditis tropicalis TaxID=1561998 RepID=A0A1I7TN34_9PELO
MDILKCADATFLKNGSRILKAYVEIGFHPLVMTNSDRTFMVECLDSTILPIVNVAQSFADCTHLVRMASEWSSMTEFHVGDAIVHEWSCKLPNPGKTQTFLTNCNALSQNGYHLKAFLDPNLHDVMPINAADHFLMGISYREPIPKISSSGDSHPDNNRVEGARILHPSAFQPIISPPIDSHEEFIETITFGSNLNSEPIVNVPREMHLQKEPKMHKEPVKTEKAEKFMKLVQNKNENRITETTPAFSSTTMPTTTTTTMAPTKSNKIHKSKPMESFEKPKKTFEKGNALVEMTQTTPAPVANLKFYSTTASTKKLTPTTPYASFETSTQVPNSTKSTAIRNVTHSVPTVKKYDKFVNNNADWRFDDKAINDSDIVSEKQTSACFNATIISSQRQCKWSGVEHLLLIWSFASLIVWMMLIALFLYRYSSRKPQWIGFREQELRRVTQSRVLSQDHPWLHADAFEERNQNKNEIEINHFT